MTRRPNSHLTLLFTAGLAFGLAPGLSAADATHGVDPARMDPKIEPCKDPYLHANGTWLAKNPIPPDRSSWGAGSELQEQNFKILRQILEELWPPTGALPPAR